MAQYSMHVQPIYECISFIECYVNHEEYKGLERFCKNDYEIKAIEQLREVCKLIGKAFQERYAEQAFLFTYLNSQKCVSPMKAILFGKCDFQSTDYKLQIKKLEAYYKQDPMRLLDEFLECEKGQPIEGPMNMAQYLQAINELIVSDEVKWKLWSLQNDITQIFEILNEMVDISSSIIDEHSSLYDDFLNVYQQEFELAGAHDFYESLTQVLGYRGNHTEVYLIPSVAACKSVSFVDQKEGKDFVLYGIGMYRRISEDTLIRDEDICIALKLMGDRSKFDILRFISKEKAYGAQIAQELNLTTPTISYHMQALLCAQLVTYEKSNNKLYYGLNKEYLRTFFKQVSERLLDE